MKISWFTLLAALSRRVQCLTTKPLATKPRRQRRVPRSYVERLEQRSLLTVYTLPATADGTVSDRDRDGDYDIADVVNSVVNTQLNPDPTVGNQLGVYQFNLSSLPSNALISSVVLRIDVSAIVVPSGLDYLEVNFFGGPGNNSVNTFAAENATARLRNFVVPADLIPPGSGQELIYDISLSPSFFQSQVGVGAFVSVASQMVTSGAELSIKSSENAGITASQRPQLIVTTGSGSGNAGLAVTASPNSIAENAGSNAGTVTITRSGVGASTPLTVTLTSSDPSEATVPATATFPANATSVTVQVTAVDDKLLDGSQPVQFVVSSAAGLGGSGPPVADQTFGGENGILIPGARVLDISTPVDPSGASYILAGSRPKIVVQADGRSISLISESVVSNLRTSRTWKLTRLNTDGTYDHTFGLNGVVTTTLPDVYSANTTGMTLQSDGKIVVTGSSVPVGLAASDWFLVRYNSDGSLDTTFGTGGIVHDSDTPTYFERTQDVVQLADGKLLVSGIRSFGQFETRWGIVRFLANGSRDTTFGVNGVASIDTLPESSDVIGGLAIQSDGKIVVTGSGQTSNSVGVARFNANGTLDTSFDSDGFAQFFIGSLSPFQEGFGGYYRGKSVVIQPDGKTVIAARYESDNSQNINSVLVLMRLTSSGTLDSTFSGDGFDEMNLDIPVGYPHPQYDTYALTLQADGKILIGAGSYALGGGLRPTLVRYLANGTRDASFGANGIFRTTAANGVLLSNGLSYAGEIYSLAWQSNGQLLALVASEQYFGLYLPPVFVVRFGEVANTAVSNTVQVTDRETLSITINRPFISETAGSTAAVGTVVRGNTDIDQPLVVTITSSDTTEATAPTLITIPAGASSASFNIAALDDGFNDGDQTVTFTVSASGYVSGTRTIMVTESDLAGAIFSGDILVTRPGTAPNTYEIAEYSPSGTFIHAITVPWGIPGIRPTGEVLRDLIQDQFGKVYLYDGNSNPFLTAYDPGTSVFSSETFAGWTSNTSPGNGGVATFHQYVFVSDNNTASGTAAGIVRFDRTDSSVMRISNPTGYQDLAMGLNGRLYALNQNRHLDVYDPVTMALLTSFDLPVGDYRGIAVKANGEILAAGADGRFYNFTSTGGLVNSVASGVASLTDIDLEAGGRVIAGGSNGMVVVTDVDFLSITRFSASSTEAFVAFALDANFPVPTVHTTATPVTVLEDVPQSIVDPGIVVTDDGIDLVGATVKFTNSYFLGADELSFVSQNGINGVFDVDTGTLRLDGVASVANYQAALRAVTYHTSSNTPQASRTVTFTVTDGVNSGSASRVILVTAQNDAPYLYPNQFYFVAENSPNTTTLGAVKGADEDSPGLMGFTIVSGNETGIFTINPNTGVISVADGTQLDYEERRLYLLGVTVSDGSLTSAVQTLSILVTDQNDNAPVIRPNQSYTSFENAPNGLTLGSIRADDIDTVGGLQDFAIVSGNGSGAWFIDPITGVLSVLNGAQLDFETQKVFTLGIRVSDGVQNSAVQTIQITLKDLNDNAPVIASGLSFTVPENSVINSAAGTVTATDADTVGTLQNYVIVSGNNAGAWRIDPITGVITVNNPLALDFESTPDFTLGITVSDGVQISSLQTVAIHLTNVNESPSLSPAVFGITESVADGFVLGTLQGTDPDAGQTLTYTITSGNTGNNFTLDPATGVLSVSAGANFDYETTPGYTFTVTVTDNGSPALFGSAVVIIGLSNGNDAPIITAGQSFFIAENSPVATVIGTVDAHDPDAGQTLTYSILSGNSSGAFAINPLTGVLSIADAAQFDYETKKSFSLTVKVTDNGTPALAVSSPVTVFVTNVNEPPTVVPATFSLTENSPKSTLIGNVQAADQDAGQSLLYTIVSGNTGNAFNLHLTLGTLSVNNVAAVDFETNPTFSLQVRIQDNGSPSQFTLGTITVNLINVVEPPRFLDQAFNISEGAATGTNVGTIMASDPDQNFALNYQIVDGDPFGIFSLNPLTGVLQLVNAASLDYETAPFLPLQVRVSKDGNPLLSTTATVMINVGDINERPVMEDVTFSVNENSAGGTVVGTLTATDPDFGQSIQYSISGGNINGAFLINPTTGTITVANGNPLNFETLADYVLSIDATDSGFPSSTKTAQVTIHLNDLNESPVLANKIVTVPENTAVGTILTTMTATNPEMAQQLSYFIIAGNANGSFAIDPATGQVSVVDNGVLDFEDHNQLQLTIRVIDNGQPALAATATLSIQVTDVNEPPHLTPMTFTLAENSPVGTVVGTILAIDEDGDQNTTYAVTASDLDGLFTISPNGLLSIAKPNLLDFETHPVIHLTITTSDDGTPSVTESKQFTVQLTNVDEPPEIVLVPGVRTLSIPVKPQAFDAQASIRDVDTQEINLANTTVQVKVIDHASTRDRARLLKSKRGDLVIKGKNILYQGTLIATRIYGKKGGIPLTVNFNSAATQPGVEAVLRKIYFRTKGTSGSVRTLEFSLTGLANGQSSRTARVVKLD